MIIKKNFLLVCENAILDESKRLSLINTFDILFAPNVPVRNDKFFVIGNFRIEKATGIDKNLEFSVTITSPTGKEIIVNPPVITKPFNHGDLPQNVGGIFEMRGVIFSEFGEYKINFFVNKKLMDYFCLDVKQQNKPNVRE